MYIKSLFSYITLFRRMSFKQIYWRIKKILKYNVFYKYKPKRRLDIDKHKDIVLGDLPFKMDVITKNDNFKYYENIISVADKIKNNSFNFLNIEINLGKNFNWNSQEISDSLWKYNLNYFDFNLILLKAYLYTNDYSYINKIEELMDKWINETKLGEKVTWDPYPISRRVVNWIITLCFFDKHSLSNEKFLKKVKSSLIQQTNFLYNNLELDLQNNHLTSNAKALIWSGVILKGYHDSDKWFKKGYKIFKKRVRDEIQSDGFQNENSSSYHMVTIQDYLETILLLKANDKKVPEGLLDILEKMFEALQSILKPDGSIPLLNDSITNYPMNASELMAVGALIFNKSDFKWSFKESEMNYLAWIFGNEGLEDFISLPKIEPDYKSVALKDTGFYVMKNGWDEHSTYLLFNCSDISPRHCPGHGHADALSFELYAKGQTIMMDPGVYSYHDKKYRYYFKSTKNHNTVIVDGKDQSEILGSFRFGKIAEIKPLNWIKSVESDLVSAQHNGYKDVIHKRSIEFNKKDLFIINDIIEGYGTKNIDLVFNMGSKLKDLELIKDNKCICIFDKCRVTLEITTNKIWGKFRIEDGWISEEWNKLQKNKKIIYSVYEELPIKIKTKIYIE